MEKLVKYLIVLIKMSAVVNAADSLYQVGHYLVGLM